MNTKVKTAKTFFATTIAVTLLMVMVPSAAHAGAPAGCTPFGTDTLEMMLLVDGSGSIDGADFTLQKTGYKNAVDALLPIDGSVAIGVLQFSNLLQTEFPLTVIDSAADKTALSNAIMAMGQIGGGTLIGAAITNAEGTLLGSGNGFDRQIIDVSTDGASADDASAAAVTAVANGIEQVNALGIGVAPPFNAGAGSFSIQVANFAEFEDAIMDKLAIEFQCQVAGEILPIDTTALFVSGAAANAAWMIPVIVGIAGTAFYLTRSRWNITSEE
jgi:uncharacterized protein YegL